MLKISGGRIPVAITIAGSDSGGGAGIQADLKTFAALGVYGTTAITCVTAQNTYSVTAIECLEPEIVREQVRQVAEDMGIDAGKTGMLYTAEMIRAVAKETSKYGFLLVVDPVMVAKSGAPLLKPEAEEALKEYLLPVAKVVTPNRFEAERLSKIEIKNIEGAKMAAERIHALGPEAVVVKGGHIESAEESVDILYYRGEYKIFRAPRIHTKNTHGTGCSFSAAITAYLARGEDIVSAVKLAKEFITEAIKFGLNIGKGAGPVNPMARLYREAERYGVLRNVAEAKNILESMPNIAGLVPEVGMNVAMALSCADSADDVAAIPGRLVKVFDHVKAASQPEFGASSHLARYLIEIMKYDARKRAAINLRYSENILKALRERGLRISFYDRSEEPEEIKRIEGMTIPWGVRQAIGRVGGVPDVIYHMGDIGKEPMIVIFGEDAVSLAKLAAEIAGKSANKPASIKC
ncbi:MAG: bifunctional hydroxymethylpyrimidine kinase/phosphomethylpyrimidine kinase [Candidatus Bathyarchaeia archaeon]